MGMSAGEEKDIDITFPEDYHKDLAGKAVVFHVKVNKVTVTIVPEQDDEFAKDVSSFETLEELRRIFAPRPSRSRKSRSSPLLKLPLLRRLLKIPLWICLRLLLSGNWTPRWIALLTSFR